MVKGIHASAGAMRHVMAAQAILANNLANAQATGFKQDRIAFRLASTQAPPRGSGAAIAPGPELITSLDQGPGAFEVTERTLDLAIQGGGFFTVQTPDGERYTRAGHFQLAEDGTLITPQGFPILADGGPITLPTDTEIQIATDGTIRSGEQVLGRIGVAAFEGDPGFTHVGGGLLATEDAPIPSDGARVLQGVLEGPNIEPVQAMVDMITLLRHFEMNQKAITAQDESLGTLLSWARG